jgi:predicted N-formylglutamate amidohydrolase
MRYTGDPAAVDHETMPDVGNRNLESEKLIADDEPSPFCILNPDSTGNVLLVCDHASRRFPRSLGDLGLDPVAKLCHLAWDIGAGPLTERLAQKLSLTAVLANYSRLVVDCNRELLDAGAFLKFGDGIPVPGNRNLTEAQRTARAEAIYWPYHRAIEGQLKRLYQLSVQPVFLSIHSFTPVLDAVSRPWQVGILWDKDRNTAELLIQEFARAGYLVGDNLPYSGKAPQDFTVDQHAERAGISHAGIEIRQDLIHEESDVERMAEVMCPIVQRLMTSEQEVV